MSTYQSVTRHPKTHEYQVATWHDDYFAPHSYGVEFPDDKVVYPASMIESGKAHVFLKSDIVQGAYDCGISMTAISDLLNKIDQNYKERIKREENRTVS